MKLEKIKKTFGDYKLELSWGQVQAIGQALEANHESPLSDELSAEWQWYMQHVPGPGEDEDAYEAKHKAAEGEAPGENGAVEGEDVPIPMPPGSEAGTPPEGAEEPSTTPPEEEPGANAAPVEGAEGGADEENVEDQIDALEEPAKPSSEGAVGGDEMLSPEEIAGEHGTKPEMGADHRLPKPPRE